MKRLFLWVSLGLALLLAACGAQQASEQAAGEGDGPLVTVYSSPA